MTDNFTPNQLKLATLRMGLENNALLRILISQNIAIMEKLGIEWQGVPDGVYADLMPGTKPNDEDHVELLLRAANPLAGMLSRRAWEWVQLAEGDHLEDDLNE